MVLAYEAVTITRVDQLFVAALDQFFVAGIMYGNDLQGRHPAV